MAVTLSKSDRRHPQPASDGQSVLHIMLDVLGQIYRMDLHAILDAYRRALPLALLFSPPDKLPLHASTLWRRANIYQLELKVLMNIAYPSVVKGMLHDSCDHS